MDARDEVDSPLTVNATSPPKPMGEMASASAVSDPPTPAAVLKWIATAKGEPWFASRQAAETGIDRDCLDEPMNVLRLAGLIRIDTWVRGVGQGYVLTPEGRDAARTGLGLPSTPGALPQIPTNDTPAAPGPTLPSPPTAEEQLAVRVGIDPRPPLMVPLFIVVNVLCFLVGLAGAVRGGYPLGPYLSNGHAYILHRLGAVTGDDLLQGQWWRLFTCCFVHIGIVHLLVNLFTLGMLGLLAESLWGRWRLAAIYFISGLAGSCMAMAIEPGGMLAGASGALWGLLMSLVAWLAAYRRELPPDIATDWVRKLWIVFILNVGISFLPGISWQAHLGGGIAGFLAATLLNVIRFRTGWRRVIAVVLLAALPVACIGGLAAAIKWSAMWQEQRRIFAAREQQAAHNAEISQLDAALAEFRTTSGAHLEQLRPEVVLPVEEHARREELEKFQLWRFGEKRKTVMEGVVKELEALKTAADALVAQSSAPATGIEQFDRYRARVKAFAEARSKSFDLLLTQLKTEGPPNKAAWVEWNTARLAANELWQTTARK